MEAPTREQRERERERARGINGDDSAIICPEVKREMRDKCLHLEWS